ncbi:MAG: GNAT family N-acetyltransferase [Actinomycetota bacterium]
MTIETERLIIRPATEADRERMIELWTDAEFMVYSDAVTDPDTAHARFDLMLAMLQRFPFAKQPIIEKVSGHLIGYTGVGTFEFEGQERLEYGYRLELGARGNGYATEAGLAMLSFAQTCVAEPTEIFAIIDPRNEPSQRVAEKLRFAYWKMAFVNGFDDMLWRQTIG